MNYPLARIIRFFILFLLVLVLAYRSNPAFSEESLNLSSAYKDCNVILIIIDALRPDYLSCYGHSKKTSPNIDALAKHGIIFQNTFSQSPLTVVSTVSTYTSLYPFSHGVKHILKDKVPQRVYTLAGILDSYGYKTVWFGAMQDPHSGANPTALNGFQEKNELVFKDVFYWIKQHHRESFFMTIHSYQAHDFWFPFQRFNNKFSISIPKRVLSTLDLLKKKNWEQLQESLRNNPESVYKVLGKEWVEAHREDFIQPFSEALLHHLYVVQNNKQLFHDYWASSYHDFIYTFDKKQFSDLLLLLDGSIFDLDTKLIGGLVEELKRLNIYDKTIIIVTSAHGNEFMEHGVFGHGPALYDESIRIPLIFYLPGLAKKKDAKTGNIQELAESIDILPTILDLLNIPAPSQAQGISLVGLMEGKRGALQNKYVFSQTINDLFSIRSRHWKLILDQRSLSHEIGPTGQLFFLKADKYEKNNLIRIKPVMAEELKKDLNSKLASLTLYQNENSEFMPGLSEETKQKIIKTGYW